MGQVAKDFDLTETAVREWVKQAERYAGTGDGGLTGDERPELAELRRENRRLRHLRRLRERNARKYKQVMARLASACPLGRETRGTLTRHQDGKEARPDRVSAPLGAGAVACAAGRPHVISPTPTCLPAAVPRDRRGCRTFRSQ